MKFNLETAREDTRRIGIILAAAGILNGVLEGGEPVVVLGLCLVGIVALVVGNLEKSQ